MKLLTLASIVIFPAIATFPCMPGPTFICSEFLSPVVAEYNFYPDSILFTGVASREIRADYMLMSVSAGRFHSAAFDSSSDKIQQGLSIGFDNGAIVLKGKTVQSGIRNLRMILTREDSSVVRVRLKIFIKSNEECNSSNF